MYVKLRGWAGWLHQCRQLGYQTARAIRRQHSKHPLDASYNTVNTLTPL